MEPSKPATSASSRRPDGEPETAADRKFFDLRASGYTGPIDQDGNIPDTDSTAPETRSALEVLNQLS